MPGVVNFIVRRFIVQSIWKFKLEFAETDIDMPIGAKILCVKPQDGFVCVWAWVPNISAKTEKRIFLIYHTGYMCSKIEGEYIGTVQLCSDRIVLHVFEKGN
jgi:hypothetical protein